MEVKSLKNGLNIRQLKLLKLDNLNNNWTYILYLKVIESEVDICCERQTEMVK